MMNGLYMKNENKIIFIFPNQNIKNLFYNREEIIFFEKNSFFTYSKEKKKRTIFILNKNEQKYNLKINYIKIIDEIRKWGPVWSRWNDKGDQFETYFRKSLLNVIEFVNHLKKLKIQKAFFFTSSSHHIDSLEIELSLKILKKEQIYFRYDDWTERLIPFSYKSKFSDRKILKTSIHKNFLKKIYKIKNKNRLDKKLNIFENSLSENYLMAILLFLKYFIKDILVMVKIIAGRKKNIHHENYSSLTHLNLLKMQKHGIEFYKRKMISLEVFQKITKKQKCLVIAAHNEPEASMYPEGGIYNNIIEIILTLRKTFNGKIFFKDHPISKQYVADYIDFTRVGIARSKNFYEKLLKLDCQFLDYSIDLNNKKIIDKILVTTVTGTIAAERSLKGFKTLVFGNPWYNNIPGMIKYKQNLDISKVLENQTGRHINVQYKTINFLNKMFKNSTTSNYPGIGNPIPDLSEKSKEEFIKTIEFLIKKYV